MKYEGWYKLDANTWKTGPSFNWALRPGTKVWRNYIHSIARGAPNLEELGFGKHIDPGTIAKFVSWPFYLLLVVVSITDYLHSQISLPSSASSQTFADFIIEGGGAMSKKISSRTL